jgi:hypothetical protein
MTTNDQQISDLARRAAFIVVGRVVKSKASLDPALASDNTVIISVDQVLTSPAMFAAIVGQQITVRLPPGASLKTGQRRTFFANGWVYGATLAVDAVGVTEETDAASLRPALADAHSEARDQAVKARLDSSVLGVVGTVTSVARTGPGTGPISEHDPDWHEATIQVDEVIKGEQTTKETRVLFPKSDDARWRGVPKYSEGQQGIFMLQRATDQAPGGLAPHVLKAAAEAPEAPNALTALHHDDYLPLSELERVRALAGA